MVEPTQDAFEGETDEHAKKLLESVHRKTKTVEKERMLKYLHDEQTQRQGFLKLPWTFAFFLFYVMCVLGHDAIGDSSMAQRVFRSMISGTTFEGVQYTSGHKDIGDIDTVEDIYTFMHEVMVSLFLPGGDAINDPRERNRVLRYNQLVGGLQVQQVRRKSVNCSEEYPGLGPYDANGANPILSGFNCYPWYYESEECFGPTNRSFLAGMRGWCPDYMANDDASRRLEAERRLDDLQPSVERRLDYIPNGGGKGASSKGARFFPTDRQLFSVYLHEYQGLYSAHDLLNIMQQYNWLDFNTAWFGVKMLVFNPDMKIWIHVITNVYFVPGGSLRPKIAAQSFSADPLKDSSVLITDAIWFLLLLRMTVLLLVNFVNHKKKGKVKAFFANGWNWLAILTVFGGLVVALIFGIMLVSISSTMEAAMEVRSSPVPVTAADKAAYELKVVGLHENMGALGSLLLNYRLFLCWYTVLASLNFLESFSAQPRLAVVTNTLIVAMSDLFHFLIVTFMIFMSFVMSGMFLFGRRLYEFSNMSISIISCFRMMLGDFDWEALGKENPSTAFCWLMLYMLVMMLLMMNMLMAIIMDTYTAVKGDADESSTIFEQTGALMSDLYKKMNGQTIGLKAQIKLIESIPVDEVDEDILVQYGGEQLPREDAVGFVEMTRRKDESELNAGVNMSEAMRMIGWVKISIQKIFFQLEAVMEEEVADLDAMQRGEISSAAVNDSTLAEMEQEAVMPPPVSAQFLSQSDNRLERLDKKLAQIEGFVQEALQHTAFRGKDLRNRLAVIEDMVKGQKDSAGLNVDATQDAWDSRPAPQLS
eukprot:TRINITY_DN2383_c0_g1_i2.p1 TRINITY_DN2383_c0_g1~~TRINITY_DN2383_c0_g1_i2.p1  ORF type:complete len:817 (-),score=222.80 TRINITY_DN2383_c0_g1_i2:272-2722(-)